MNPFRTPPHRPRPALWRFLREVHSTPWSVLTMCSLAWGTLLGSVLAVSGCALTPGERRTLASAEPVILAAEAAACADAEMVAVPCPAIEGALVIACPAFVTWTRAAIDRAVAAGAAPAVGERIVAASGARARVVAKVVPGSARDAGTEGGR